MALASMFPRPATALEVVSRFHNMNAISSFIVNVAPTRVRSWHKKLCPSQAKADEETAAKAAARTTDKSSPTIFDKIVKKEIPATIVYEDEKVLAFRDINPQAPVHVVLIPKDRDGLTQLSKSDPRHKDILGHLLYSVKVIADQEGLTDGYRVVINDGPNGCQSVYHLHLHILGGRQLKWPPG
ncbi:hypothetical protein O6H91_21G034400 [Diphasiastrum complanatum]|uniref:Uncharacterized protein n=1 Tax=Diphasiastrum complanatum TaxID=34168 RepID=A0ACC2AJF0_DIPCM|nr:hypothetical protein O6H91_21G034400 [Diphasiastrum complanatum]